MTTTLDQFSHNGRTYTIVQQDKDYCLTVLIPATVTEADDTVVVYFGPSYREARKALNKAIASN